MTDWFEYPTNYSNGTSVDGVGKFFFDYPSHIIESYAPGILLLIFLMVFGAMLLFGSKKALAVAGFITFIFSVYFFMAGILNPVIPIAMIIITIIGLLGAKEEQGM